MQRDHTARDLQTLKKDASRIFYAGIDAVEPMAAVRRFCRREKNYLITGEAKHNLDKLNNIFIIGAGKAGAPMASAIEDILGERITKGIVNVKYGHVAPLKHVKLIEAGHPVPDKNGQAGASAILNLATRAKKDDLVICLVSGGGSALLPLPVPGLVLKDKQNTIKRLISCGATIHEINSIRKHTSLLKGGGLAKAVFPANLVTLILSDVVGDDLDVIASGPTVCDSSTFNDCLRIIAKYGIEDELPAKVVKHINDGADGKIPETPKAGDDVFARTTNLVIGSNIEAVKSAKQKAESLKYNTLVLSSMIEGNTKDAAHFHCAIAKEIVKTGIPLSRPACIISGGETTVNVTGKGLGGRNQEFALDAALEIAGLENTVVLSGGTDGTDGPTDAAGAFADSETLKRAYALGMDPFRFLSDNDSYNFFKRLGDLFITGPTNTNVMDLRIILLKQ
ncbi:MAG: glycerate kinase [Proteobacteria bacterium]|nr:glycerate kinase [Pseudomonadota bacterium]MBU1398777.1 glycerate kinase [Pseudomonadota bacterium]MBU1569506.1 glycerate kinase [Pseudomonadota bacterium]